MNIPQEFADYLIAGTYLSPAEQNERFLTMHLEEIKVRSAMMRDLNFEKDVTKYRIKKDIEWAFEFGEQPDFLKKVDSVVDDIYKVTRS